MEQTSDIMLSVDETAALLRLNRKTVYELVKAGDLPGAQRFAGTIRVHKATLLASFSVGVPPKQRKPSR